MENRKLPLLLWCYCTMIGFLMIGFTASSQPYEIGHISTSYVDSSRNNRNIPVEIYYPATTTGDDTPIVGAEAGTFPVVAFGHGFVMGWDAYENIWTTVVPQGFIMVFPRTETGILPSHLEFGKDLAYSISQTQALATDASSIFFDRIGAQSAVMGHSMGGGAAFLAADFDSNITTLAVLAPAETNPSAIEAAGNLTIQSLVFAGANDCVTPPSDNQLPMYNALLSDCKTYISINGGSHCQMANSNFLCSIGEGTCSPDPEISRAEQHAVIDGYLINWLRSTLLVDCEAGTTFDGQLAANELVTFERNCLLCNPLATSENELSGLTLFPNPFNEKIVIDSDDSGTKEVLIYNSFSGKVLQKQFYRTVELHTGMLAAGFYFYVVTRDGIVIARGKLIKK